MARVLLAVSVSLLTAASALAQGGDHDHMAMAGMDHVAATVSPKARREIDSVMKDITPLATVDAASGAGFRPVFGWIPTMGVHFVNRPRMNKEAQSNLATPSNLMFSRIDGRDSLVGAAYAYYAPSSDSTPPSVFDGRPAWHEHADLDPPGMRLVMLHVWFVPSPDGPFAGTNPNLPFWAAGLSAVDASRMHDAAFASRVRRTALALAEVADTSAIFPNLEARPDVRAVLAPRRDTVRSLLPELKAAQQANDAARFDRVTTRIAAQWDAMDAAYVASARTDAGKKRIEQYVAMLMNDHGH